MGLSPTYVSTTDAMPNAALGRTVPSAGRNNLSGGRGRHHVDSLVCDVQGSVAEIPSANSSGQVYVRLDLEMKKALQATYVLLWAWFVLLFGPNSKR